ncbi:MAG: DotI/IcmL/TraM family protein [Gammaproteobacteria bacterium]|nr:DotI/IcmL/TraM family protein [Gammaproteobacteria bacterium]
MAVNNILRHEVMLDSNFYREHYHHVLFMLMGILVLMMIMAGIVIHQVMSKPLPQFNAVQNGKRMLLIPYEQPNLLPDTILRWASKAATAAYTFGFASYQKDTQAARPYFTNDGWQDYQNSLQGAIEEIVANKLFVKSIVSGTPVISNEGDLPGKGYVWRVQIPFLVVYEGGNTTAKRNYYVSLSVVHVPTSVNPAGIGIDQFVMR